MFQEVSVKDDIERFQRMTKDKDKDYNSKAPLEFLEDINMRANFPPDYGQEDEERMNTIGQNGNTGEHYDVIYATDTSKKASDKQEGGDHYRYLKIQPYDYCYENNLNNLQSEAISYISRYNLKWKDSPSKQKEDLRKAIHTIELLLEKLDD